MRPHQLRALHLAGRAQTFMGLCAVLLLLVAGAGCTAGARRPAPKALADSVNVVAMPADIRTWGDCHSDLFFKSISESIVQSERTYGRHEPPAILSISSGGLNGAYAAGLLCGWSEHGTRPVFRVVTGVSIGAIIAPFAFLGSEYDSRLEEMARAATAENVYRVRGLAEMLLGDSIADNAPLARFVARYVDEDLLRAIASEHAKGRRLFIATTNLDTKRPVIWDLGAIASSGSPSALRVLQQVIVASAAVPVLFPPTYINVEYAGGRYDEMHVDGAVSAQIMLYGQLLAVTDALPNPEQPRPRGTHYVILNRQHAAVWKPVEPKITAIAAHSIMRLMQDQGVGDLWQLYAACLRDGLQFRLAAIPEDEEVPFEPGIDQPTVARLFQRGRAQARSGYPWVNEPPGLQAPRRAAEGAALQAPLEIRRTASLW